MQRFQRRDFLRPAAFSLVYFFAFIGEMGAAQPVFAQPAESQTAGKPAAVVPPKPVPGEISESQIEDELKARLVGKMLYLRGGYLGENLSFNQQGDPVGNPAKGSFTLGLIQVERIHFTKRKVELDGARYAMHFLGALPYEDPQKAVDEVRITARKKVQRISIERELVVKPKKSKDHKEKPGKPGRTGPLSSPATHSATNAPEMPPPEAASPAQSQDTHSEKAHSTPSPAAAHRLLDQAIDRIFSTSLDSSMRVAMPEFWQLYFTAQESGKDFQPPGVLPRSAVDHPARLVTSIAPDSNDFAQANGIAGRALYRVVIGASGKPEEIAVMRPIGFGLDESAVAAIRKATFQPAMKGGQPVAQALDLGVMFRIYSNRTAVAAPSAAPAAATGQPKPPLLPGPYSAGQP